MSTVNERISACIENSGLTKTAFADKINLSQPFISKLCAGTSSPSDRTISDICLKFDINENWLRTGEGEMRVVRTRDQETAFRLGMLMAGEPDGFKQRFIATLTRLDESDWAVLEKVAIDLMPKEKD